MLGSITKSLKKVFGDKSTRDMKSIMPLVDEANSIFSGLTDISNEELRARSENLKKTIADFIADDENKVAELKAKAEGDELSIEEKEEIYKEVDQLTKGVDEKIEEVLMTILPEAFAVVKETARRFMDNEQIRVKAEQYDRDLAAEVDHIAIEGEHALWNNTWMAGGSPIKWEMLHYDVQLIGGIILHQGKIAEMQTGEGKTLVATLPVFLNALTGKGVHIVTVNNYLAKRDAEWMAPIFQFHGLTIDVIDKHRPNSAERRKAYQADITYGTNNEFGFDYLRDNMTSDPESMVQRKHHYAIVDEVDSVLIDDARTPLIISGPTPKGDLHEFNELKPKVQKLVNAQKQLVTTLIADAKKRLKGIDEGAPGKEDIQVGGLALFRAFRGLPKNKALIKFLSEPGVKNQLLKTEAYYLQDQGKEMPKADELLFFTIDEKQNAIELTEKGVDLISGADDPTFYIMPDVGAAIAEIEKKGLPDEEQLKQKDELLRDFSVKSERIHTINQLLKAYTLFENDVEYVVMDNKVKIVDEQTGRIMEGRRYSDGLHQAIESKENVKIEASTQTYATVTLQNFFRMYHKLAGMTGTAETEAGEFWDIYELDVVVIPTNRPIQRDDREDLVFKTAREKYKAISDEIIEIKNQGRPVLVGTTSVEVSELLSKMLSMKKIEHNVLNAKLHQREAEIVAQAGIAGNVTIATNMAGRGTDIKLSAEVKEAGGLAIIGTERHDSRRVDRQLRGRAGRQGDPGSSQFFVSLEDNLMRLFGSDRIARMMDRLGIEEGEVIQHSMITKSIERAQKKVEENNFGIRKRLLEYDDVMNTQREVIYKKRRYALFGERMSLEVATMFNELTEATVMATHEDKDFEGFKMELLRNFSIAAPLSGEQFDSMSADEVADLVYHTASRHYGQKSELLANSVWPVIKDVYENQSDKYKNIVVPFTDGKRTLNVVANLEKAYNTQGKELIREVEKGVMLAMIDNEWKEHLREMDDLRQSVQNARYEQKDPLLIYKFESFELFKNMINRINGDMASFLIKASLPANVGQGQVRTTDSTRRGDDNLSKARESKTDVPGYGPSDSSAPGQAPPRQRPKVTQPIRTEKKVGRNEPCPCGSGKKYKQCHGKAASANA
ncbi:MAG: preprotein translocase subunit SecA [Flavobacteriales bacterium]|nr:preprotein translocase subunit SecA [Flavobacteriales bacterium]NNK81012.1 preprotein translocase subunit SecA [Flavobacteriales bacterium]